LEVVIEVRRQFKENPDIMTYKAKPDYDRCVSLVTEAALREMQFPGLVCVVTPIVVGLVFRFIGECTGRPLLGAEVLASYLMFGTVTGILMALFLDTSGGAWDNAKKYIELGHFGGKNSEAHKAAITGDTVGDPFVSTVFLVSIKQCAGSTVRLTTASFQTNSLMVTERYRWAVIARGHQIAVDDYPCSWSTLRRQGRSSVATCLDPNSLIIRKNYYSCHADYCIPIVLTSLHSSPAH
jgi:hypothetical protein